MGLSDDLQNSSFFKGMKTKADQSVQQMYYDALTTRPLETLRKHKLIIELEPGNNTFFKGDMPFDVRDSDQVIRIGGVAIMTDSKLLIPVLLSPQRNFDDPERQGRTHRFAAGHAGAKLWLTDTQTGCTVMIVDWGGTYSMIHLQPKEQQMYGKPISALMGINRRIEATIKKFDLSREAKGVIKTTSAQSTGRPPLKYITIESQTSAMRDNRLNVIGIATSGQWTFYKQTIQAGSGVGTKVSNVETLQWKKWE